MRLTVDHEAMSPRYEKLLTIWGHIQHELLFVSWALADAALLVPFLLGVMGWARYWEPGIMLLWLLMLMLFAFNLTRFMSALQLPPRHQQTVMALTLFLVVIFTLPTFFHGGSPVFRFGWVGEIMADINEPGNGLWLRDMMTFVVLMLVWMRGLQLGRREYSVHRAGLRLRVGGLILAPVVIWMANTRLLWDSTPYILLFFLAGLTALALIRAEEIERGTNSQTLALNPRWLTAVFLASLFIIFTAGTMAVLVSGEAANTVVGWLAPFSDTLRVTGTVAVLTFLYLLVPIFELVESIVHFIGSIFASFSDEWAYLGKIVGKFFIDLRRPTLPANPVALEPIVFDETGTLVIEVNRNEQMIILLLAIALILLVALLANRLYRETAVTTRISRRTTSRLDEDEEGNLMQRLLGRLGLWRNWQTAVSIRRIYRNMLHAADVSGYPRLETETPYEFLKTLAQAWPENKTETQLITNAYVKVRYGELPETQEEIQAIKDAWRVLEVTPPIEPLEA
ncbi:MAG: DUF4129 domain-containing protein [Ardenticatenaceae bacterium]|nr:DUF4129 domain-containing protein [Ardenticatenaceae bacterium]